MKNKIRWGILGAANIALKKVIPAMLESAFCDVTAIASRSREKARFAADSLGITNFYDSYEALLNDAEIDAVYIPLPNHLHHEWTKNAAEAGKHVLCEKPLAMNADEARSLIEIRNRTGVKILEAFMVRTHPQWREVKELIRGGKIGNLQLIKGFFSYDLPDPQNVRNHPDMGGGALMDIGCYCINLSRFIFESEPLKANGLIEIDALSGIDKLTSAMIDFPNGQATFTCAARLVPFQRMEFFGDRGRLEVEIPFNIPPDRATRILFDDGTDLERKNLEIIEIPAANQYKIQADLFARAIIKDSEPSISLEDSFLNTAVIDAVRRSAVSGLWEKPEKL